MLSPGSSDSKNNLSDPVHPIKTNNSSLFFWRCTKSIVLCRIWSLLDPGIELFIIVSCTENQIPDLGAAIRAKIALELNLIAEHEIGNMIAEHEITRQINVERT